MPSRPPIRLNDPVTQRMHQNFTRLQAGQTVGEALEWLRHNPPPARVIYLYVVDEHGRLQGVVPTRRLLLSPPDVALADLMIRKLVVVPAEATLLDVCEFFIQHRLLAFPVVAGDGRILGVVDIDLYTDVLAHLESGTPAARLVAPLTRFLRVEAAGGVVLLLAAAASLILANSPLADAFEALWHTKIDLVVGGFSLARFVEHADLRSLFINDGLMVLFFLVVGLEIKRELTSGELADPRKALLPVVAALGGMVVPAVVYTLWLRGGPALRGWAVPTATDIAFVVGVLTLFGGRVPHGLKILLLTLAIADDIGGVLVIALVYSSDISLPALGLAGGGLGLVVLMRLLGVRGFLFYAVAGVAVWLAFLASGIHPTVAGVLLGLLTPHRGLPRRLPIDLVSDLTGRLLGYQGQPAGRHEALSPLDRLEHALHPWVAFGIMPLFAFANAGVAIGLGGVGTSVALGVMLALVVGKPLGIVLFSWVSVQTGLTRLPAGVSWGVMAGAGCLGGIGFTMALFIAGLAFQGRPELFAQAKIGILLGSLLSSVLGCALLLATLPKERGKEEENHGLHGQHG